MIYGLVKTLAPHLYFFPKHIHSIVSHCCQVLIVKFTHFIVNSPIKISKGFMKHLLDSEEYL